MDALDVAQLLQRLQHDHHHNSSTVGVGNDAAGTVQSVLGVALGHHQGHVGVHAESRTIVNHHSAILRNGLGKLLGGAGTSRCEGDVYVLKVIVMLEQLHRQLFAAEGVFRTCRALRAKQHQFVHREISLIKQAQEFLAHGA